jgi:FkbM family methyltransferase
MNPDRVALPSLRLDMKSIRHLLNKLAAYLGGILTNLRRLKPDSWLRIMTDSENLIKQVRPYNFSIILSIHDRFIGRPILLKSTYEEHITHVLLKYLKSDTHFLDIGANIGYYSLLVASQCPAGRVFSFEPDKTNFRLLQASIAYNGFGSIIQAYPFAVSERNEFLALLDLSDSYNSGAKLTAQDRESFHPYINTLSPAFESVQAVSLDSFLPQIRLDLVKIDIEGHEPFAIKGMVDLLIQNKPVILTEFSPATLQQIGKTTPESYLETFTRLGYHIAIISQNAELIHCHQDVGTVLSFFEEQKTNHIDLLLEISEAR